MIPTIPAFKALGQSKELSMFVWQWTPIFKVNTQPTKIDLIAKIEIFSEQMDG